MSSDDNNHVEIRIGEWYMQANARLFWNNGMDLAMVLNTENKEKILAGGILENVGRFNTQVEIILNDAEVYTFERLFVLVRKCTGHYVIEFTNGARV